MNEHNANFGERGDANLDVQGDEDARPGDLGRRDVLKGLGATALSGSLAGCTDGTGIATDETGLAKVMGKPSKSTLRYAQVLPPVSLDPVVVDDPWSAAATSLVFQGLYAYDHEMNLVPVLAEGQPETSDGGKTYTVTLRTDATFQDGSPVTAEDVVYTYEVPTRQNEGGGRVPTVWQVNVIDEVRATGDRTVEFRLNYPYPAFDHALTRGVVPKSVRASDPKTFGTEKPVGSGPYVVETLEPGSYAVLKAWDDYWAGVTPAVDKVKMVTNPAGLARSMSMKTGQSDVAERVEPKLWDATAKMPDSRLAHVPSYNSFFVGFNCSDPPMDSPKVREAVDYLVGMDDFVEHVVTPPGYGLEGPTGARQYGPVPNRLAERWNMPVEEWASIQHRKNETEAEHLLSEAGVSSWSPKVLTPEDKLREKLAEAVVHGLRSVGFRKARVVKQSWSTFRKTVTSGDESDYAMWVGSWSGYPDPDTFLYPLFHREMEGLTNGTYYENDAVMNRISKARRTRDRKKRKRAYERAIETILTDRVHLPAFTLHNSFAVKDHVKGFEPHPLSGYNPEMISPEGRVSLQDR